MWAARAFDVSLIASRQTALAAQTAIDFGLVVRTPMIEITTIGAGGGSIAYVDRGGLLQVGPESAGAVPGPVCYGQGNDRPTLTDANVVLGRHQCGPADRRRPRAPECRCGESGYQEACRRSARPRPGRSGGGDHPCRQQPHGRGHSAGVDRARPQSARFRADAVRRRRGPARRRADEGGRTEGGACAALSRSDVGARLRHRRHAA